MRDGYIYKVVFSAISVLATVTTSVFVILNVIGIVCWPTIVLVSPCLIALGIYIAATVMYMMSYYIKSAIKPTQNRRRYD